MPYRLKKSESVLKGVRRVIREQASKALDEIADPSLNLDETIHQVRKRCKMIRAVLRLAKSGLGSSYALESSRYRNAAKGISTLRDARAVIETYDTLTDHFQGEIDRRVIHPVRTRLEERQRRIMADTERCAALLHYAGMVLNEGRMRADSLVIDRHESILTRGFRKTLNRARSAMNRACKTPTPEAFHEWRKRVKHHGYQVKLMRDIDPAVHGRMELLDKLGEELGLHHNLHLLRSVLDSDALLQPGSKANRLVFMMAGRRMRQIEQESLQTGRRLLAADITLGTRHHTP